MQGWPIAGCLAAAGRLAVGMHRSFFVLSALGLGLTFSACREDSAKAVPAAQAIPAAAVAADLPAPRWLTDLDEGIKVATAEKKAILVDFTGSDWCGWCIRLKKEVFDQKEFAAVSRDFVLVELDFPQKRKLAPEQEAKNKAAAEKFAIEGFPTILLLSSEGEPFAQTGYEEGGPVKYLAHLAELLKSNTAEGRKAFAQSRKEAALVAGYEEEIEKLLLPHLEKKDSVAAEAALAKFIKEKDLKGAVRLDLVVNARVAIVQECKPGDAAALLKVLDEVIAETPAGLEELAELKEFRAQVASEQGKK
jgi:thioredoxin-related protein